jgi:hypothetical protein
MEIMFLFGSEIIPSTTVLELFSFGSGLAKKAVQVCPT